MWLSVREINSSIIVVRQVKVNYNRMQNIIVPAILIGGLSVCKVYYMLFLYDSRSFSFIYRSWFCSHG